MATQQDYVVLKMSACAAKTETTVGTDAIGTGNPAAGDWVGAEMTVRFPQQSAEDPSNNGTFDANSPIPTGIRPEITIRMPLRGAGTAGAAPEIGRFMKACRFRELLTASAIGAPTAATAGDEGSATLPATPFNGGAQAYRGMPAELSGNPATSIILPVTNFSAGRVASLPYVFPQALSAATLVRILANALYSPTSDPADIKPLTIHGFYNGLRHRIVGCVGTARLEMASGQPGFITFTMRGMLVSAYEVVALPSASNIARLQAPVWMKGISRLDGQLCNCSRFAWDLANELVDPENPEAEQGVDNPIIVAANQRIEVDPFSNSTRSPTRFGKYRNGQAVEFAAVIGQTAGNRVAVSMPSGIITNFDASNRSRLGVDAMTLSPNVPNAGVFLAVF